MSERTGQSWKGETSKAHERRLREGFYEKFIRGRVIDIGAADDPITPDCDKWDYCLGNGDAEQMNGVHDETFLTVYASHILEHVQDPVRALINWWRILQPGGFLVVCVPSKTLYEKKESPPSRWNGDHKTFWNVCLSTGTHNLGLVEVAIDAGFENYIYSVRVLDDGYDANGDGHPQGEYSIELILAKPK